jgi:integrase
MGRHRGHGEGTIYQRADGRWCAQLSLDGGTRKTLYGKTRQEVARRLVEATRDRDKGLPIPGERQTVEQYLADWLRVKAQQIEPNTLERYTSLVRLHLVPTLGKRPLARLSAQQVQALLAKKLADGLAPRTVHHIYTVLKGALADAEKLSLVQRNVCNVVSPPRPGRYDYQILNPEQARAFLDALHGDYYEALFVVGLNTALRQGELLALTWDAVDLDGGWLQVKTALQRYSGHKRIKAPKTDAGRRRSKLTQVAVDALRAHRVRQAAARLQAGAAWEDHNLVFPNRAGRLADHRTVTRSHYKPALRRAGLPDIRFHDMRHSCSMFLLLQGISPKVVSELLGHSSVSITLDVYSHVTATMQQQAADALDCLLGS